MQSIAYVRVSTEEQVCGTSLDSQEKACIEFAKLNGYDLPKQNIYIEQGESAKIINRTQLQNMLSYAKANKGKIEYCIVWKVDRLARSSEYHHALKALLLRYGVKLKSVTEPIDESPMGALMEGMLAAIAQFDNDIRTARTTSGMRARTMQGGWPHQAPFGYKNAKTINGISTVEPDEGAPLVEKLLKQFATGAYTTKQAVDLARNMGIMSKTTGNPYGWQVVKTMLENPLYAGFVKTKYTNGEYISGLHKAIISPATHYKIKAILSGRYQKNSRHAEDNWPLRGGFIKCFHCGHALTGSSPKGRDRHYPCYSCPKCRISDEIKVTSKNRDDVHEDFCKLLATTKPNEDLVRGFYEVVIRKWNLEYKEAIEREKHLQGEIKAIQEKKSRVIDLFIDGKLTNDQKESKMDELNERIADRELQRVESSDETTSKEQVLDAALMFMTSVDKLWKMADIEVRKQIQDLIFPEGVNYHFVDGFGTTILSKSHLLIKEIALAGDQNPNLVVVTGIEPVTLGL